MTARTGDQLASTVSGTRVIVVRAPADGAPEIACGGSPMVPASALDGTATSPPSREEAATLIGKRYVNAAGTLELLCTASGAGELSCDGAPMTLKTAKPLPASD
ncbi:hypothetical protein E1293_01815 [Actinomadura darangshiensis]|uniref:Uncharacterized protein n=1 Tax=Actinomadura darangshiensis TaxID=705336 RepID=A0A4R5BZJ3_9ACTN|nr:hypothetical protein [Actinomadura darangshiensis]TDD91805.1 hypothetical protein E1293_01815 [Actinomadura darangshiensis]